MLGVFSPRFFASLGLGCFSRSHSQRSSRFPRDLSFHGIFLFLFQSFILNHGMGFSSLSHCSHSQKSSVWGSAVQNPGKLRGKSIPPSPILPLHPRLFRILEFLAGNPKFPKFPLIPGCSPCPSPFSFPIVPWPIPASLSPEVFISLGCEMRSTLHKISWLSSLSPVIFYPGFFYPSFLEFLPGSFGSSFSSGSVARFLHSLLRSGFVPKIPNIPFFSVIPAYPNIPILDFSTWEAAVPSFPADHFFTSQEIPN